MNERQARMALLAAVEPASPLLARLVADHGARDAWEAVLTGEFGPTRAARAEAVDVGRIEEATDRAGARFVVPGDAEFSPLLESLEFAGEVQGIAGVPLGLWLLGPARLPRTGVAMVGSRACSAYGDTTAHLLAADLSALGIPVVSGGAYGIDAAAHRGALAVGGPTVAVMACGIDEVYPPAQAALLHRIGEEHLRVSEYPPGARPTRSRFLARNRLIAALTDGTVLVEAAARSGARNTVNWAQRCGRVVMAVPGPVHNAQSYLPHQLIRDQEAVLVDDAASIAAMVGPLQQTLFDAEGERREFDGLDERERAVLEAMPRRGGASIDELALLSGLRIPAVAAGLRSLERRRFVAECDDGAWELQRTDASRATRAATPRRRA